MDLKYIIGILAVVIVSVSVVYITFNESLRIRVDADKSVFYTYQGRWLISGEEYNRLFNGTKIINRITKSIVVNTTIEGNKVTITRSTRYQSGALIKDTYSFDGTLTDKELFPISHKIEIFNASGMRYRYTAIKLKDAGEKRKLDGLFYSFGYDMAIELQEDYLWAWIGYPYGSDSLSAQYLLKSDYEVLNIRLFDPIINGKELTVFNGCLEPESRQRVDSVNESCIYTPVRECNRTYTYVLESYCPKTYNYLKFGDEYIDTDTMGIKCSQDGEVIHCDDCYDGNCDGIVSTGESSAVKISDEEVIFEGHNADKIKDKFIEVGII